ncbi:MAG: hypothetical protein EP330_07005 [Deltaproteobacteria bacterium]|nr:MAG: hypothetical protein EP330_07005 [Deltaproteobacteria bacterium]
MTRTLLAMLLLPGLAWAGCDETTTAGQLRDSLSDAERAFAELDIASFQAATDRMRAQLPCVREVVPDEVIATTHRFEGLRRFADNDAEGAALAFAASRSLDPAYVLPEALVPLGNPVRTLYEGIDTTEPAVTWAPPPLEGHLRFDGAKDAQRPAEWPTLFQRFDGDGVNVDTAYLWPEDALPAYEARLVLAPKTRRMLPWVAVASAATIGAVTTYGMAFSKRGTFLDPETPATELPGLQKQNHTLTLASGVLGGVALGAGAGAVVTGVF